MSKYIELTVVLNDDLGITDVVIGYNDTGLPSDSKLIKMTALTILKSLNANKEDVEITDTLNALGIERLGNN